MSEDHLKAMLSQARALTLARAEAANARRAALIEAAERCDDGTHSGEYYARIIRALADQHTPPAGGRDG